jgi:hypothetical protein
MDAPNKSALLHGREKFSNAGCAELRRVLLLPRHPREGGDLAFSPRRTRRLHEVHEAFFINSCVFVFIRGLKTWCLGVLVVKNSLIHATTPNKSGHDRFCGKFKPLSSPQSLATIKSFLFRRRVGGFLLRRF